jgi:hypothetical protein
VWKVKDCAALPEDRPERTWAVARVACPQISSSRSGVNHFRLNEDGSDVDLGTTNAVSRLNSLGEG